jgi:RNA polymerase sigma-70 factor (ECF subfamily)
MPSTEELVKAARAGDVSAFSELVRRYEGTVTVTAWSIVRDFHAAQDVAQESFVIAYQKLDRLRVAKAFGPWVLAIVRREALSARQQRARQAATAVGLDERIPALGGWWSEFQEIVPLLARLPEHECLVVSLRYLDGLSVREVAEETGRPVGTVTKQLSRAIRRLRDLLIEAER